MINCYKNFCHTSTPSVSARRESPLAMCHEPTHKVTIKWTMVKLEDSTFYRYSALYLSYLSYTIGDTALSCLGEQLQETSSTPPFHSLGVLDSVPMLSEPGRYRERLPTEHSVYCGWSVSIPEGLVERLFFRVCPLAALGKFIPKYI